MIVAANFIPSHLTLTVNNGETVHLSMELLSSQKRDVTWKYNGEQAQIERFTALNVTIYIYICVCVRSIQYNRDKILLFTLFLTLLLLIRC